GGREDHGHRRHPAAGKARWCKRRYRQPAVNVSILFFATLKERAGRPKLALELDESATVADLKLRLSRDVPALAPALPSALVSINHEFAFAEDLLHAGDEVGLFPPVSGGSDAALDPRPTL